jgi:hypothetical protein
MQIEGDPFLGLYLKIRLASDAQETEQNLRLLSFVINGELQIEQYNFKFINAIIREVYHGSQVHVYRRIED